MPQIYNFIKKETLAQVFFCEFCEIYKGTFFREHLWATASEGRKYTSVHCNKSAAKPFFNIVGAYLKESVFV